MSIAPKRPSRQPNERALEIGTRIRTKRELLGFTADELGAMIGVTGNAVTQYETGRATPKPKRFEALALSLGTTTTWLLTGNEPDQLARAQTKVELDLLSLIREIPLDQQALALAALRGMAETIRKK